MDIKYVNLPWDSNFFGFPVGRLEGEISNGKSLLEAEKVLKNQKASLAYYLSDNSIEESLLTNSAYHWFLADKKIIYKKSVQDIKSTGEAIFPFDKSCNLLEGLYELALQSGIYSRFNKDALIGKNKFEELYRLWLQNSIEKRIAFEVLLYVSDSRPIGLVTLGEKKGIGDIGIIAVDGRYRGKGIGKALMNKAENIFFEKGYSEIQVVTQDENFRAKKLYESLGYTIESKSYFYHIWNKGQIIK